MMILFSQRSKWYFRICFKLFFVLGVLVCGRRKDEKKHDKERRHHTHTHTPPTTWWLLSLFLVCFFWCHVVCWVGRALKEEVFFSKKTVILHIL